MAMVAVSTVAVASASATLTGFVYKGMTPPTFTMSSGVGHMYTPKEDVTITCTKDSVTKGKITGALTVEVESVTFTGCEATDTEKSPAKTCHVNSPGAKNVGEVVTNAINGKLGYIEEFAKEVGLLLEPKTGTEFVTIDFETGCTPVSSTVVTNGVIGAFPLPSSINKEMMTYELNFVPAANHEGNVPASFEKEATKHELRAFGLLKSSLESKETIEFSELVEIKA
jgi:hypothetical protein